jgi:hypothetical protein
MTFTATRNIHPYAPKISADSSNVSGSDFPSSRILAHAGTDCDQSQSRKAIRPHAVSISPNGHVLLTLDTLMPSQSEDGGRDLVVWGTNYDYELGNGKRGSLAAPTWMHTPDGERYMLRKTRAKEIRDLSGTVWKRGIEVEQRAVAGYGNSVVYWKLV